MLKVRERDGARAESRREQPAESDPGADLQAPVPLAPARVRGELLAEHDGRPPHLRADPRAQRDLPDDHVVPTLERERTLARPPVLERRATRRRARLERLPHVHEALIVCVALRDVARGRVAHVRGVGLPRLVRVRRVGGHLFRELRCRPCPAPGRDLGVPYGVQPVADVLAGDEGGVPVALVRHLVSHRRRVATCSLLGGDVTDVVWTGTARGCQNLVGSSAAEIPRLPRF